jgi:protein gp37
MNHSKIEWLQTDGKAGYSVNPVKGYCPMACPYCYARRLYDRFGWDKTIRFDWSVANELAKIKTPSRIFWGSTMELFGDWVDPEWMRLIFEAVRRHPQHTHIFLTKCPQNLSCWSPYPLNVYIGVSVTNLGQYDKALLYLKDVHASVKFLSFEPLLEHITLDVSRKV